MSPPPSYHTFDGVCTNTARRHRRYLPGRGRRDRECEREFPPRRSPSRSRDVAVVGADRDERREHHHRRYHHRLPSSPTSHLRSLRSKAVLNVLKINLLRVGGADQTVRGSNERTTISPSRPTRVDLSNNTNNVHYTIHNHWPEKTPEERIPHARTPPNDQPGGEPHWPPFVPLSQESRRCGINKQPMPQGPGGNSIWLEDQPLFETFVSGLKPRMAGQFGQSRRPENVCHAHGVACGKANYDIWCSSYPGISPAFRVDRLPGASWYGAGCVHDSEVIPEMPSPYKEAPRRHGPENCAPGPCKHPSMTPTPPTGGLNAGSALAQYNRRWEYVDSVQHPRLEELPWPKIRPGLTFDQMKCEIFCFFARGCGLQPDPSKAPRLDFKLSPRSPYPSYHQRQQESERVMLKTFKQQMQRDKLRWHEDKLLRKFPETRRRDDEKRKAVWAAIAEGSAVCDKRLANML